MMDNLARTRSLIVKALRQQWRRVSNELIQNVPDAIAICEFDCRRRSAQAKNGRDASVD